MLSLRYIFISSGSMARKLALLRPISRHPFGSVHASIPVVVSLPTVPRLQLSFPSGTHVRAVGRGVAVVSVVYEDDIFYLSLCYCVSDRFLSSLHQVLPSVDTTFWQLYYSLITDNCGFVPRAR